MKKSKIIEENRQGKLNRDLKSWEKKQLREKNQDSLKQRWKIFKILRTNWECSFNRLKIMRKNKKRKKKRANIRGGLRNHGDEKLQRERDLELGISSFRKIVAVTAKRTRTAKQTEVNFWEDDAIKEASFFSENKSGERREKVEKQETSDRLVHKLQGNRLRYIY